MEAFHRLQFLLDKWHTLVCPIFCAGGRVSVAQPYPNAFSGMDDGLASVIM
jgi:hypothetical protein